MSDATTVKYIEGHHLSLRPIEPNDVDRYYRWMNDRAITRFLLRNLSMPIGAEREWVERAAKEIPQTEVRFAIVLHDRNEHIGGTGIHRIDWVSRTGATGIFIGELAHWGKGYGFEAKMLLLHFAFMTLNLRKVVANALATNAASCRNIEKQGYHAIGRYRAHHFRDGAYVDEIAYELFAEEFAMVWEQHAAAVLPP